MTASSFGPRGEPEFKDGDAPDVALNPTQAAKYAALVGNRRIGTTAQRNAALTESVSLTTPGVWEGLKWLDTNEKAEYTLLDSGTGLGWRRQTMMSSGVFLGAVNSAGNTAIAHGLPGAPSVQITQMQHPSLDANSRFFETILWNDPTATTFRVRNIDRRDNSWAGDQQVRFSWLAVLLGV